MNSGDVLLAAWEATLARKGDAPAIFNATGKVVRSFGAIEDRARVLERDAAQWTSGLVKAIDIGNDPDFPALFLACLRRRVIALPLDESTTTEQRKRALAMCDALHASTFAERRPVLLKLTSGTTAAPRAIRFRSEQLLADCEQICETMGITEYDVNFGVIPLSHSYGFSNLLTPLLVRGIAMVLSRDRLPRAVLDGLARTTATVFPGMPVFYQAFSEMDSVPRLPHLRLCISAGAPLPLTLAQKFRARFGLKIHSFYGSSECGGICYDRDAPSVEEGFVGEPMTGVTVQSLDPASDVSQIEVHSGAVADGYFPDADEEKLRTGRFVPDDLLTRTAAGWRIVGRITDVINVAGKKVNPAEVEAILLTHSAVRAAVVFGRQSPRRNEEVAACVVAAPTIAEPDLLEFCRERLSGWQVPKRIFFLSELPANERGKISRRTLAERFATN